MAIAVHEVRLSFIWIETFVSLLADPQPAVPLKGLGRPFSYKALFEGIRFGRPQSATIAVPWTLPQANRFWHYYAEQEHGPVPEGQTWRRLVPLRAVPPVTLRCDGADEVEAHLYYFPFAVALEVTATLPTNGAGLALYPAVDLAHRVYFGAFDAQWNGGATVTDRLDPTAATLLGWGREQVFGRRAPVGTMAAKPFSVATFVRIDGVDPAVKTPEGKEVHRALQGLSTWAHDWEQSTLAPLQARSAEILSRAPASHVLYADARARVGWFPSAPTYTDPENRRFSCYHRNQVCAILQLEALGHFAQLVAGRVARQDQLSVAEEECARNAAGILGRLYGGTTTTYRSDSCRRYIDENQLVTDVDLVRERYKLPKLK